MMKTKGKTAEEVFNESVEEIQTILNEYDESEYVGDIEEFKIIEDGDWVDDGKYSYCDNIIQYKENLFCIRQMRSGSYFTDYEYSEPYVYPVKAKTITKTIYVKV